MKKVFTFTIVLLFSYGLFAQIVSYDVIEIKTYDNNRRTSYLHIESNIDENIADFLGQEINNYSGIYHFSFLDFAYEELVFSSDFDISEQNFIDILNDIISDFEYSDVVIDFPQTHYLEASKIVKFYIDDSNNRVDFDSLIDEFSAYSEIVSISINHSGNCKLEIQKSVSKNWIEQLFAEKDLEIVPLENLNR